jgi:ribonuclease-3 family protein
MTETNGAFSSSPDQVSAANLAYLGDCVYELYVREYLVKKECQRPSVESLKYVTAHVQSGVVERILPMLTEEEESEYKRGRNIGHSNIPKSSTAAEYRRATGLETLFGWLYLKGNHERLRELFDAAFADVSEKE